MSPFRGEMMDRLDSLAPHIPTLTQHAAVLCEALPQLLPLLAQLSDAELSEAMESMGSLGAAASATASRSTTGSQLLRPAAPHLDRLVHHELLMPVIRDIGRSLPVLERMLEICDEWDASSGEATITNLHRVLKEGKKDA
jgi:hypothetical protein